MVTPDLGVLPATVIARRTAAWAIVMSVALAGSSAVAQSPPPASSAPRAREPGMETIVITGVGSLTNMSGRAFTTRSENSTAQFDPGPALQLFWGYHVTRWLSVGAHVGYSYHTAARLPPAASDGHADIVMAGAYTQLYLGTLLGWRRFSPTFTVGLDPTAGLWQAYHQGDTAVLTNVSAGSIWGGMAFEYNVSRIFAVGFAGQASWWIPYERCTTLVPAQVLVCPNEPLVSNTYLFAGFSARFTLD